MTHDRRHRNRITSVAGTTAQIKRRSSNGSSARSSARPRYAVLDLDISGAFIAAPHPPPKGSRVDIVLWLRDRSPLAVKAEVQRAEVGCGMGVRFLDMSEKGVSRLRGHLMALRVKTA